MGEPDLLMPDDGVQCENKANPQQHERSQRGSAPAGFLKAAERGSGEKDHADQRHGIPAQRHHQPQLPGLRQEKQQLDAAERKNAGILQLIQPLIRFFRKISAHFPLPFSYVDIVNRP